MERHLDLIRTILMETERNPSPMQPIEMRAPGYAPDQIAYHVRLLHEAGYLDAMDLTTHSGFVWQPKTLTWQGHEFLDAARNTSVWQQVKTRLKDRSLDAPLSVIQQLAVRLTASLLLDG